MTASRRCAVLAGTALLGIALSMTSAGAAFAAGPTTTGQPGKECGEDDALMRPGNAASAPGSAFNPNGMAGTVYAGEQPQNSKNPISVSQYDVACFQVSSHVG